MASTITPASTTIGTTADTTSLGTQPQSAPVVVEDSRTGARRPVRAAVGASLALLVLAGASAVALHHASSGTGSTATTSSAAVIGNGGVRFGRDDALRALTAADLAHAAGSGISPRGLGAAASPARAAASTVAASHVGIVGSDLRRVLLQP